MLLACLVAPALQTLDQAYQLYTGIRRLSYHTGVLAIFLMGFFWKRTSAAAALTRCTAYHSFVALLKFLPAWTNGRFSRLSFPRPDVDRFCGIDIY